MRLLTTLALVASASPAGAAPVFKLADDSATVVRGVVDDVRSYKQDAFLVFTIMPRAVLKGSQPAGVPIQLVEERVFGSERPYFVKGTETLVFAVPMPSYSYYRESLPAGSYLQWTDRNDTADQIAALSDPAVADAVSAYLAAQNDAPAEAERLGALMASPVPRLRADALEAVERRHEIATALGGKALEPVRALLADEHLPVTERAAILVRLAHAGAPGAVAIAQDIVGTRGPLQAAAVDALVALGRAPREEDLLALTRSDDPALRLAALRGLATLSSRAALDRVTDVVANDRVAEVRIAGIRALGAAANPGGVAVLGKALRSDDKGEILAASEALARIANAEAVEVLGAALRDGSLATAFAAAFALKQTEREAAYAILREQREIHPDPQVRRAIKMALGERLDEHED